MIRLILFSVVISMHAGELRTFEFNGSCYEIGVEFLSLEEIKELIKKDTLCNDHLQKITLTQLKSKCCNGLQPYEYARALDRQELSEWLLQYQKNLEEVEEFKFRESKIETLDCVRR